MARLSPSRATQRQRLRTLSVMAAPNFIKAISMAVPSLPVQTKRLQALHAPYIRRRCKLSALMSSSSCALSVLSVRKRNIKSTRCWAYLMLMYGSGRSWRRRARRRLSWNRLWRARYCNLSSLYFSSRISRRISESMLLVSLTRSDRRCLKEKWLYSNKFLRA